MTSALPIDVDNLLLTLAWMGEMDTNHLYRLYWPDDDHKQPHRCRYLLRELRKEGYLAQRYWYAPRSGTTTTKRGKTISRPGVRSASLWSLTKKGLDAIDHVAAFTPKYLPPRARQSVPHDTRTSEFITRAIELRRASTTGLNGLYVEREVRLNPPHARPIMDALIMVSTKGSYAPPDTIPWSNDPTYESESRSRYALENDRNSEAISVIAGKADAYRAANTRRWEQLYGEFPMPVWMAPTEGRLRAINRAWRERWPDGTWLMTTDDWLNDDYFVEYRTGTLRERGLFRNSATLPSDAPSPTHFPWHDAPVRLPSGSMERGRR